MIRILTNFLGALKVAFQREETVEAPVLGDTPVKPHPAIRDGVSPERDNDKTAKHREAALDLRGPNDQWP